jgi:HEAT repeat protein
MSTVTLGRWPKLREVIDYYARDEFIRFLIDVCRTRRVVMVISRQQHWEPNWTEDEVQVGNVDQVRRYVIDKIADALAGIGLDERPPFYPSFHQSVWKRPVESGAAPAEHGGTRHRLRDCVFESDVITWRDAFQDVYAIVDRMDRHGVRYQLKFSGHRSLHVVLPAEVLPTGYRGKGTVHLARRLLQWSGSRAHPLPEITRMPYSLNEDTGLVCLPIERGALPSFRPWQANLHLVAIERDAWPGAPVQLEQDVKVAADQDRVAALVQDLEASTEDAPEQVFYVPDLAGIRARYASRLKTLQGAGPVGAAWRLLSTEGEMPEPNLASGLEIVDADARWLVVEAYLLRGATLSGETLGRLLEQDEDYVRPAALDVVLRFEQAIFAELVEMIRQMDRHPARGARAAHLLTQSPSLRARTIEAILQRTDRSPGALIAAACMTGAMGKEWASALDIVQALRQAPDLTGREKTWLAALDLMSELGGWDKREEAQRVRALEALGPEVTELLLIAAASPNRRFRRSIVTVLASVADERAIDLLIHALDDEFSQVRRKAIPGLIRIGEPAVDPLIQAAASDQVPVRRYALLCLGYIGAARARPALLQGLDDSEQPVRQQGLKGLKGLAIAEDVERLERVLREDNWELAQLAVEALASIGDSGQAALRRMALEERSPAAAWWIAQEGDPRGREILASLLSADEGRRQAAAEFLRELCDERCIPYFAGVLKTITHWRGGFIAHELGRIGTAEAVAVLIQALSRDSSHVRRGAVRGLWEARDPMSVEPLIRCLYDEDRKVRGLAASALADIGEPAAQALESALQEGGIPGKSQQQMARDALDKIRGE